MSWSIQRRAVWKRATGRRRGERRGAETGKEEDRDRLELVNDDFEYGSAIDWFPDCSQGVVT